MLGQVWKGAPSRVGESAEDRADVLLTELADEPVTADSTLRLRAAQQVDHAAIPLVDELRADDNNAVVPTGRTRQRSTCGATRLESIAHHAPSRPTSAAASIESRSRAWSSVGPKRLFRPRSLCRIGLHLGLRPPVRCSSTGPFPHRSDPEGDRLASYLTFEGQKHKPLLRPVQTVDPAGLSASGSRILSLVGRKTATGEKRASR